MESNPAVPGRLSNSKPGMVERLEVFHHARLFLFLAMAPGRDH